MTDFTEELLGCDLHWGWGTVLDLWSLSRGVDIERRSADDRVQFEGRD